MKFKAPDLPLFQRLSAPGECRCNSHTAQNRKGVERLRDPLSLVTDRDLVANDFLSWHLDGVSPRKRIGDVTPVFATRFRPSLRLTTVYYYMWTVREVEIHPRAKVESNSYSY